jgi:AcrR family transcriptional regulator
MSRVDGRRARGADTREQILDAARDVLVAQGYAGTTTRAIAEAAGVRPSLVHYHFGGKQQLLVAVLERENARLLVRQHALFAGPGPLAEKYLTSCEYLTEDLRSGYVRILWELWAVGLADDRIRGQWRDALSGWRELLVRVTTEWMDEHDVELPISPRAVVTLVGDAFLGAEAEILGGIGEDESPHFEALTAVAGLIEWAERRRA